MNIDKKISKLLNVSLIVPCILHTNIFLLFRFPDWRNNLADEIQLRILAGSITISLSFILYYVILFYSIFKYYKNENKSTYLGCSILMLLIVILTYFVGYFLKYQ